MKANRGWLAWALSVGLMAYLLGAATAGQSVVTSGDVVKAMVSGTALHLDALQQGVAGPRVADVEVAFSAANVDSTGFPATSRQNENEVFVQPNPDDHDPATPFVGKNASGRGAGLELGLADDVPVDPGTVLALQRAGATAPPDSSESVELAQVTELEPAAYASLLHGDALAQWVGSTCLRTPQSPIAYGRGYAADVQVVGGDQLPDGSMQDPLVSTDHPVPERNAVTTSSFVYPVLNSNGKYGLISEVHQTYAPVQVGQTLVIEVLGEWFVKTIVNGVTPATMTYGVTDPATGNPVPPGATVIRISVDGGATYDGFSLQDLQDGGINIPLTPLMTDITLGESPRAISAPGAIPVFGSAPTLTATRGAGALDVVRVDVLDAPATFGSLADLRIGHFEADLQVPAGGFTCPAAAPTTTTTTTPSTSTTAAPTTTTAAPTTTTAAPTTTTGLPPTSSTAPTTTTTTPPPAPAATALRVQPRTVG